MPTFNFGRFIGETLDSIIPQMTDELEIVILDGGSTDNTPEVVQRYQKLCPQIRYFRQPVKGGIDQDMHLSVEKARGEYCWLFSSDDIMRPGAINEILKEIKRGLDVYLCDFSICDFDCKRILQEHSIFKDKSEKIYNLSEKTIRAQYVAMATQTTAFFSFMGAIVIKRARWLTTPIDAHFFGTCWAHAARIFHMIPQGLIVKYLPLSFMRKRSYNDSFMDKGIVHRFALAIDGYREMIECIFGEESIETFHINRVLRAEFPIKSFIGTKLTLEGKADKKKLFALFQKIYFTSPKKIHILRIFFLVPNPILLVLMRFYRKTYPLRQYIFNRSATTATPKAL
jgi:abequosyltransferase